MSKDKTPRQKKADLIRSLDESLDENLKDAIEYEMNLPDGESELNDLQSVSDFFDIFDNE